MWLGIEGSDGYAPWWYDNLFLSRHFPAHPFSFWDTDEGQIWARRVWTALTAERAARTMRKPTP